MMDGEAPIGGEEWNWRLPPGPQPGGRRPAPGGLGLVQAFINTHFDLEYEHGADLLATPASLVAWLERRRIVDPGTVGDRHDLERALALREGLRQLARGGDADSLEAVNGPLEGAAVVVRFTTGGPRFERSGPGVGGALGLIAGLTAEAMLDGSWRHLKICPGEHCGWAFYDQSRNQAGRWCSMSVCGGRAKARAHYRRRVGGVA